MTLKARVPENFPFVRSVQQCTNMPRGFGACEKGKLVDMGVTITSAARIVIDGAKEEGGAGGAVRVKPLVYSRLARGSKSTFLIELFDALKALRYAPIVISFNGSYQPCPGESQLSSIVRLIGAELMGVSPTQSMQYEFNGVQVLKHIEETSEGRPVILLIDELNSLSQGQPLMVEAAQYLKNEFLDKANRFLVFTTHITLDVDTTIISPFMHSAMTPPSPRGFVAVHQPLSKDLMLLRNMSPTCAALTPVEVALYGGIPSLIFATKGPDQTTPRQRFQSQGIQIGEEEEGAVLRHFVTELLQGDKQHPDVRRFDMFASSPERGKVWWPMCYISCIMGLFREMR